MRIATSFIYDQNIRSITEQQTKVFKSQQQLATGKRVVNPRDDPPAAARILDLDKDIANREQYQDNITYARNRLEHEESALGGALSLLQRVRELTVQAANGTNISSDRLSISYEVEQLRDELFGLANTRDAGGDFIFAGFQGSAVAAAFSVDTSADPRYSYNGDLGQRTIQISDRRFVPDTDHGYGVFMQIPSYLDRDQSGDGNPDAVRSAFETLDMLVTVLQGGSHATTGTNTGADPNDIANYLPELDNVIDNFNDIRTQVGGRLNALQERNFVNEDLNVSSEKQRSDVRDLNYAEAVSQYQLDMTTLEAAQKTFVQIQNLSLFNFI